MIYKLNMMTQGICQYIQLYYPDEYQRCHQMSSKMEPAQKYTQILLMESFHSGHLSLLQDPALQRLRYRLTRLKTLFLLSPFLLMVVITIITY
ncbi:hypothetical protein ABIS04_12585 [Shewanella sp. H8]|uniref:hypothetical protein n=1 Tax=Shewanella sp. H8 TaxID=3342676 RepID=UPI003314D568